MNDEQRKQIERALDYSYEAPNESFLFENGKPSEDPDRIAEIIDAPDRKRILAIGSNRAPKQLACKFKHEPAIAAVAATLHDFDVVYAARIASYGAATLVRQTGAIVRVAVLYLTKKQLQCMHKSEGVEKPAYRFERYREIDLRLDTEQQILDTEQQIGEIDTYVANVGPAYMNGAPIALKEVKAIKRNLIVSARNAVRASRQGRPASRPGQIRTR